MSLELSPPATHNIAGAAPDLLNVPADYYKVKVL